MEIAAICYVSMSELAHAKPDITYEWVTENNHEFLDLLQGLGMDTTMPIDRQEDVIHKNRLGKTVRCDRWVGLERVDKDWVKSGYASQAAIDKSKNNKILLDLYRQKGEVL